MSTESTRRVQAVPLRIHIPGQGDVDLATLSATRAIEAYDEKLMLAKHEITGDWCVMLKRGPWEGKPYPVLGLGQGDLPSPEEITQRLMAADTKRHGDKILHDFRARNETKERVADVAAEEGTGVAAEAYEWAFRQMGSLPKKTFIPQDIPKGE